MNTDSLMAEQRERERDEGGSERKRASETEKGDASKARDTNGVTATERASERKERASEEARRGERGTRE
jgi:hypothetical protein